MTSSRNKTVPPETIEIRERTIVKKFITLPYLWETPGYHTPDWSKPDPHNHKGTWREGSRREGTVDIDLDVLAAMVEYTETRDRFFDSAFGAMEGLPPWADYALEAVGWATRATRGGCWATDALGAWAREQGLY